MTSPVPQGLNVLLIGGGGREHAIAEAVSRSPRLGTLYATDTSNPGIASLAKPVDEPWSIKELYRLIQWCERHEIGLVIVGPEDPLAQGIADGLASDSRLVFGPGQDAAKLEADKAFAKQVMRAGSIPTASARVFKDAEAALSYLGTRNDAPVVKAAGLAKGKGVIVPATVEEAQAAVTRIMVDKEFGDAGASVLLEEKLEGREVSVLALVDGKSILVLETAQDHKRLRDGDQGPNTGGMGAYSPSDAIDDDTMDVVERDVLVAVVDALRRDGIEFKGVLYAGLMLTPAGPRVLEFNVRFGDPECQTLLPRLESDALELFYATASGHLHEVEVRWSTQASCCVVLASEGYPENPEVGREITGVDDARKIDGVRVYIAGAESREDTLLSKGGRVLNVVGTGATLEDARAKAYQACERISFRGAQFRRDIGSQVEAVNGAS